MLAVFRQKSPPPNLELVEARMEDLDLPNRRFRLVTCPFRAFSHLLDVETQLAALAAVRRHLEPGGTFALDVFDPKLAHIARPEEAEHLAATFHDAGREVRRWDTIRRDATRQVMTIAFRFASAAPELCGVGEIQMRWFSLRAGAPPGARRFRRPPIFRRLRPAALGSGRRDNCVGAGLNEILNAFQ